MSDYVSSYAASFLLAIGINQYSDPHLAPLGNAELDAHAFAEMLSKPPYNFQVCKLIGLEATKQAILDALFSLESAQPDDRIMVYFSGHGYTLTDNFGHETGYLACVDTIPQRHHTALKMDEVTELRAHAQAKHIAFVFDACFSGQALGLTKATTTSADQFMLRRAYQVLCAGAPDQTVADYHSMTSYLLEALTAPDSLLTLETLGVYLKQRIAADSGGKQIPQCGQITGSNGGDLVLYAPDPSVLQSRVAEDPLLREVRDAAQLWADNIFDPDFLWPEKRLRLVYELIEQTRPQLSDVERKFIRPEFDLLMDEINDPVTTHQRRSWIGERLASRGDRRPGVGLVTAPLPPLTDPREVRLWGEEHIGLPDIVWVKVNGGQVALEDNGTEFAIEPFYIAKYLITYAQFQAFIDAPDGFGNPDWWHGLDTDYHNHFMAEEPTFKFQNHPRDSVAWWDALAFCQWLNARLGWRAIPPGLTVETLPAYEGIRLPAEWEWQIAATGGDPSFGYPWGPDWDSIKANTDASGLGRTTAVGMYPAGAASCGALDMSGNIREWCLNESKPVRNIRLGGTNYRVSRGGSWDNHQWLARAAVPLDHADPPGLHYHSNGFRLCVRPASL